MTTEFKPLELTRDEAFYLTHAIHLGQAIHEGTTNGFDDEELLFHLNQMDRARKTLSKDGLGGAVMAAKLNAFFEQYAKADGKEQMPVADLLRKGKH